MGFKKTHKYNKKENAWERKIRHHKWADEVEAESKEKEAMKASKKAAKDEDHSKVCPYCDHKPVKQLQHPGLAPDDYEQLIDTYQCEGCDSVYRVNCPGSILLDLKGVCVRDDGQ